MCFTHGKIIIIPIILLEVLLVSYIIPDILESPNKHIIIRFLISVHKMIIFQIPDILIFPTVVICWEFLPYECPSGISVKLGTKNFS